MADKFSEDMLKSMAIYRRFNENIANLVAIYSQSDDKKIAKVIDTLYWKSDGKKEYKLLNDDNIVIDDKLITTELLKAFSDKKIASILGFLDSSIATEISSKMALPNP